MGIFRSLAQEVANTRVAAGAELLDEKRPKWAQEVNLKLLDVASPFFCVLGQVSGEYITGVVTLLGISDERARGLGFSILAAEDRDLGQDFPSYAELQYAWVHEIERRLNNENARC